MDPTDGKVAAAIRSNPNPEQQLRQAELFLQSLTPYASSESDRQIGRKSKYVDAFMAFVTDVLKKPDPNRAEFMDFSKFLATLPANLSPKREAVAWSTMMAYKDACLEHMRFFNKEWSEIPKYWTLQFNAVIEKQLTDGIVTKERLKPAQWHGAASVLAMVRAYFAHAFRFGPPCWDNVVAEVLCVTLQSALVVRQGDVGISDNWVGTKNFLQYRHVDVRLHQEEGQDPVFFLKFTMEQSKNNRHAADIDVPRKVLKQITDPRFVFVDPVSLLLVQALRFGAVGPKSMDDLVQAARAHPEGKIVWEHPEWPVLIAAGVNGKAGTSRNQHSSCRLDPSLPASRLRVNKILQRMSAMAGFLGSQPPTSHDLKRGSVDDIKELPSSEMHETERVMGFAYAAELADHSRAALHSGVTDKYVGVEISKASLYYKRLKWAIDPRNVNPYRPVFKPVSISGLKRYEMTRQPKSVAVAKAKSSESSSDSTDASDNESDASLIITDRPAGLDLDDGDYDPLEGGRELEMGHLQFVDKFSRINTFGTVRYIEGHTRASDNSRDPPEPHRIYCQNKSRGCPKTFDGKYRIERIVRVHEPKCPFRAS